MLLYTGTLLDAISTVSMLTEFRKSAISIGSELVVPVASTLASIFVLFRVIKIAYELMSDEQTGGLGGISLKEFLKPVVYLTLVFASPQIMSLYDSVLSYITNGLTSAIVPNTPTHETITSIAQQMEDAQEKARKQTTNDYDAQTVTDLALQTDNIQRFQKQYDDLIKQWKKERNIHRKDSLYRELNKIVKLGKRTEYFTDNDSDGVGFTVRAETDFKKNYTSQVQSLIDNYFKTSNKKKMKKTMEQPAINAALSVCGFLYEQADSILQTLADLIMSVLAVLFPFVAAIALVPSLEGGVPNFLTSYAQLSLWKVIIAVINWCISNAMAASQKYIINMRDEVLNSVIAGEVLPGYAIELSKASSTSWAATLFVIAGLVCFLSVPSIATAIVPSGFNLSDASAHASNVMRSTMTQASTFTGKGISAGWTGLKGRGARMKGGAK